MLSDKNTSHSSLSRLVVFGKHKAGSLFHSLSVHIREKDAKLFVRKGGINDIKMECPGVSGCPKKER